MRSPAFRRTALAAAITIAISSVSFAATALAGPEGAAAPPEDPHPVQISFIKYVTINPGGGIMEGVVGGDVPGKFVGQVFGNLSPATNLVAQLGVPAADVMLLQAVYEVEADQPEHSLRSVVSGGQDINTNQARLDGIVVGGWLTGDEAHVKFTVLPCSDTALGAQPNAVDGRCFRGTLTVTPSANSRSCWSVAKPPTSLSGKRQGGWSVLLDAIVPALN